MKCISSEYTTVQKLGVSKIFFNYVYSAGMHSNQLLYKISVSHKCGFLNFLFIKESWQNVHGFHKNTKTVFNFDK